MPLGTEVGLGLCDIVFDVDPATPRKRAHPPTPNFGPCLLWLNGWMDEDGAWYGGKSRPRYCTKQGPNSRERGIAAPALFLAHVCCDHGRPSQLLLSSCFFVCYVIVMYITYSKCDKNKHIQHVIKCLIIDSTITPL